MKIRAKYTNYDFGELKIFEVLFSFHLFPMKVASERGIQWKGDYAHIRQRNPRSTALSLSNAILFTISVLQVNKVVEKVCQDLTPWQVYKKGDTNVLCTVERMQWSQNEAESFESDL